jgi:hypothetical protein
MTVHDLEVAALPDHQQAFYRMCVKKGQTPRMALMLASQQAAMMGGSDQAFNEGARRKMNKLPAINQRIVDMAQKAGISTHGKYHMSSIGAPTDPLAWCSTIEDAKYAIKAKGLSSRGLINYTAPEKPPQPDIRIAPDIVDEELQRRLRSSDDLAKRLPPTPAKRASALRELREQVADELAPRKPKSGRGGSLSERLLADLGGSSG